MLLNGCDSNTISIANPLFNTLCHDDAFNKQYLATRSSLLQFTQLDFSLTNLTPILEPNKETIIYPLAENTIYKAIKSNVSDDCKGIFNASKPFRKIDGKGRHEELNRIKDVWCKEIMNYLAFLYRFNVDKPLQFSGIRTKIKIRQLSRVCKDTILKMVAHCMTTLISKLKETIYTFLAKITSSGNPAQKPSQINKYDDFQKLINKLFIPLATNQNSFDFSCTNNERFCTEFLKVYYRVYIEMKEILDDCTSFFLVLSSFIGAHKYPISFEDMHWKLFYEGIYQDQTLLELLNQSLSTIRKSTNAFKELDVIGQLCNFFYKKKMSFRAKFQSMSTTMKISYCQLMNVSCDYLETEWEDPVLKNFFQYPDSFLPPPEVKSAKKKRKRRKKKKKAEEAKEVSPKSDSEEHGEVEDEIEESPPPNITEQGEKRLMVPNINPDKILSMEKKLREKMQKKFK